MFHKSIIVLSILAVMIPLTACAQGSPDADKPVDLEGTSWNLIFIGKHAPVEGSEVTIQFEDGQANGSASCNNYFGAFTQDGEKLEFGPMGSTMMFCESLMDQETEILEFLSKVVRFEIDGEGRLMLFQDGQEALTFDPA